MSQLEFFLKGKKALSVCENIIISKKFTDDEGKPVFWKLKPISAAFDEELRLSSVKRNRNTSRFEMDLNAYAGKLAAATVVFPDLNDAKLQDSYGVLGADSLLKEMLDAGEYQMLLKKVREINGFGEVTGKLFDEAKN